MESKLEPGPETVLWLHPIQSGLLIFLSCPSQRGSGSLDRHGKRRTEQESQGWREGPGGWELPTGSLSSHPPGPSAIPN